jgi:hypothetical protein
VNLAGIGLALDPTGWACRFTSEDPPYGDELRPPEIDGLPGVPRVRFRGPAAVVLTSTAPAPDAAPTDADAA